MKTTATRTSTSGKEPANTHADRRGPAGARGKHTEALGALGNMQAQDLYARGGLRAQRRVGTPGDAAEAEADRMADKAMAGKPLGSTCAAGVAPCPACREKPGQDLIRRTARNGEAPASSGELRLGAGHRLAERERTFFEAHYQADLSGVRVHHGSEAAAAASQINARAFTVGAQVAFAHGDYRPDTVAGKRLLAHELAHVAAGHTGVRRQAAAAASGTGNPAFSADEIRFSEARPWIVTVPETYGAAAVAQVLYGSQQNVPEKSQDLVPLLASKMFGKATYDIQPDFG